MHASFRIHETVALVLFLAGSGWADSATADDGSAKPRPNILLILADDMGYSDIGTMGSEIETPNIDQLAESGLLMTNFHVHTVCTPTRAMLLSGVNNHSAGVGAMAFSAHGDQVGAENYEAHLTYRVVTVASLLRDAGYKTYMTGKWDLGGRNDDSLLPGMRGFEKSFVLVEGAADHFRNFPALGKLSPINFRENDMPATIPDDFYSSTFYADKLIEFLDADRNDADPFFAYLSFTAPHYPLHAPDAFIDKYEGVYDAGYSSVRKARIARMREAGLIGTDMVPAPNHAVWPEWDELSDDMQDIESRRMQVYAGMIDSMDHEIGKVIDYLRKSRKLANTIVVFLSDNGPDGGNPLDWDPHYPAWAEENFDLRPENLGRPGSYAWTGPGWAHVSATPFRLSKGFTTEGGIRTPAIISMPGVIEPGRRSDAFATVLDLPATFLDLAGVGHPAPDYAGRKVKPLEGKPMSALLRGDDDRVHSDNDVMVWDIFDRRAVQKGDWKIVWINKPWGEGVNVWSLYNVAQDPAEQHDLSDVHPTIKKNLIADWDAYVEKYGVIPVEGGMDFGWTNRLTHYEWLPPSLRN